MMKLYMDIHNLRDGLTAEAIEDAHAKDPESQAKYGVKYLKYWFEEGKVFCLVEAPSKEAAIAIHGEVNGHTADEVKEVILLTLS